MCGVGYKHNKNKQEAGKQECSVGRETEVDAELMESAGSGQANRWV